jgi:uracil-DNA glycosylase family 4
MGLPENTLDAVIAELRLRRLEGEEHAILDTQMLKERGVVQSAVSVPAKERQQAPSAPVRAAREPASGFALHTESVSSEEITPPPAPKPRPPEKWEVIPGFFIEPIPSKPPVVVLPSGSKQEQMKALREQVLSCPVCKQHVTEGCQIVFGVGNPDADLFFVGEAPGADEEKQGEPFVGRAGQLLTKMIQAMGLQREQVYIGNIMNWRPEMPTKVGNRPPEQREMDFCLPYLRAQIEIVKPKVLIALGTTAVSGLLGPDPKRKIGAMRGTWSEFQGIPLMITYHPSYILRNGSMQTKRTVWEDLLQVMERAGLPISEKQRGYFLNG